MNAEKKLYKTKEAMKILGIKSRSSFFKKVKRHGIVPEKQRLCCFFTDEMIGDLKIDKKGGRHKTEKSVSAGKKKAPRYCWRVSVWNGELCAYVVAKCGLTKKEADEFAAGKNAVKRPCWR